MRSSPARALLFACATVSCSPEPASLADGKQSDAARVHLPWSPELAAGGTAAGDVTAGETTAGDAAAGNAATGNTTAGAAGSPITDPLACAPGHFVLVDDVRNARDLGGTTLASNRAVACGAVYRGPPLALSAKGCADAASLGLHTLLDLRTESERLGIPDDACVAAARVYAPLPVPYGLAPADYLNDLHETASLALVFHTFGHPAAYPIYFHCTFGRDRTGIVGAMLLLVLGATRARVMQEYLLSEPTVGAYPVSLNAVLDEVEQRGGVEAVLKGLGITDQELAVMRGSALAVE
jgi:protein-tyrosine phosphatase